MPSGYMKTAPATHSAPASLGSVPERHMATPSSTLPRNSTTMTTSAVSMNTPSAKMVGSLSNSSMPARYAFFFQAEDGIRDIGVTRVQTCALPISYRVIQEYSFDNLPERLAKILLRLSDEMGHETPRGTELTHYITQEELAQMLSVRREVVSSELSRLRARGCVSYLRKGRLVINRAALTAYAEAIRRAAALVLAVTF